MPFRAHLHTVNRHRRLVRHYCFKLGLVWQGLTHDLSKYSPTEFWRGVKYYQGWRSPNDQERLENGVSLAWLHHKGRNRHHFEYWIDYCRREDGTIYISGCKMPKKVCGGDVLRPDRRLPGLSGRRIYGRLPLRLLPAEQGPAADGCQPLHASGDGGTAGSLAAAAGSERGEEAAFAAIRAELADSAY